MLQGSRKILPLVSVGSAAPYGRGWKWAQSPGRYLSYIMYKGWGIYKTYKLETLTVRHRDC
jgi:hypothetical protein